MEGKEGQRYYDVKLNTAADVVAWTRGDPAKGQPTESLSEDTGARRTENINQTAKRPENTLTQKTTV